MQARERPRTTGMAEGPPRHHQWDTPQPRNGRWTEDPKEAGNTINPGDTGVLDKARGPNPPRAEKPL